MWDKVSRLSINSTLKSGFNIRQRLIFAAFFATSAISLVSYGLCKKGRTWFGSIFEPERMPYQRYTSLKTL